MTSKNPLAYVLFLIAILFGIPALAANPNSASFGSQSVPSQMVAGQSYSVSVSMSNTGSATWTPEDGYALVALGNGWGVGSVAVGGSVGTGSTAAFSFNVTAPTTPGTYSFGWQMAQGGATFGGASPAVSVTVAAPQAVATISLTSNSPVTAGNSYSISWNTTNATSVGYSCVSNGILTGSGSGGTSGSVNGVAQSAWVGHPLTCGFTAFGAGGNASDTIVVGVVAPPPPPPPTISAGHSPSPFVAGQGYQISWSSTNAASVQYACSGNASAFQGSGGLALNGSMGGTASASWVGNPSTCTFTATGLDGSTVTATDSLDSVLPPPPPPAPTVSLSHSPGRLTAGSPYSISWSSSNASSVSLSCSGGFSFGGAVALNGAMSGTASAAWVGNPTSCTITATSASGATASQSDSFETDPAPPPPPPAPTINVVRTPSTVAEGENYSVTWTSSNATSVSYNCTASGTGMTGSASVATNNTITGTAQAAWIGFPTTCTWTASGAGGSASKTETMTTVARNNSAQSTGQSIAASMTTGTVYNVSVTMQNTGNTTWTSGGAHPYLLGSQNPQDNTVWGPKRIALPAASVAPGASTTFNFQVTGPLPGTYNQQWQMVQEFVGWFGPTASQAVTVTAASGTPPSLGMTAPQDGATYPGSGSKGTVALKGHADAAAGATIRSIEVYEGTQLLASSSSGDIDTAVQLASGTSHTLTMRAQDTLGRVSSLASATFTVALPAPPVATLTAPVNYVNEYAAGTTPNVRITGSGTASGDLTVARLELYDNGSLLQTFPGGSVDLVMYVPLGLHQFKLRAVDSLGQAGSFTSVATFGVLDAPVPKLTVKRTPFSVYVGQSYTVAWGSQYATSVSYNCTSSNGGMSGQGTVTPTTTGTLSGVALAAWVGNPTTCIWTAQGLGGSVQVSETMTTTTNPLPLATAALSSPLSNSLQYAAGGAANVHVVGAGQAAASLAMTKLDLYDNGVFVHSFAGAGFEQDMYLAEGPHSLTLLPYDNLDRPGTPSAAASFTVLPALVPTLLIERTPAPNLIAGQPYSVKWTSTNATSVLYNCSSPDGGMSGIAYVSPVGTGTLGGTAQESWVGHPSTCIWTASGLGGQTVVQEPPVTTVPSGLPPRPVSTLTSPTNYSNIYVAGSLPNVPIVASAVASGGLSVAHIDLYNSDTLIKSFPGSSINDTVSLATGGYLLRVRAVDSAGQVGEFTPFANVSVNPGVNDALPSSQSVPVSVGAGAAFSASVTIKNTGTTTWAAGAGYGLVSQSQGNPAWTATNRVPLTGSVAPNGAYTFTINANAPVQPGPYHFQWRMEQAPGGSFGTASADVTINVADNSMLGKVAGIRTGADKVPRLIGWVCKDGSAEALGYTLFANAPGAGGVVVLSGSANVATESDNLAVQATCHTPGAAHHFSIDLNAASAAMTGGIPAGTPLYVQAQTAAGGAASQIVLPCEANNCTMPGSLRIGLTTPANDDQWIAPAQVFMRAQLSGGAGPYDDVSFSFDDSGTWIPASPDTGVDSFSAIKADVAARTAPYAVVARVRQGTVTLYSARNLFYVQPGGAATIALGSPANGATLYPGVPVPLSATAGGTAGLVQGVKFYVNGSLVATGVNNNGAWTASWIPNINGTYALLTKAFDASGVMVAQSGLANVTVSTDASSAAAIPVVVDIPQLSNPDAGTLPGSIAANNDGSAGYSIPVTLPPGTAGMVPALSLDYNSSNTTGSAGLGWSLGGLSNIDRCGKTVATDKTTDGVRFVASVGTPNVIGTYNNEPVDRLCLDGQRLILVSGGPSDRDNNFSYWADGAEYRTELETFTRIRALVVNGRRAFKVETKDGRTAMYGDTADSYLEAQGRADHLAHRWRLSTRSDRMGNYISYTYANNATTGESKPLAIRWGGNATAGKPHYAGVDFVFQARPDERTAYIAGSHVDERLRLQNIITSTDLDAGAGTVVNKYTLTYETNVVSSVTVDGSLSSRRSLLGSVQVCDAGNTCLPATKFEYGKPNPSATKGFVSFGGVRAGPNLEALAGPAATSTQPMFNYANSPMGHIITGDFNGDGRTDILERYRVDGNGFQQTLYQSNADGTWTQSKPFSSITGSLVVAEIGDFDGDGLTDILVADQDFGQYRLSNFRMCWGRLRKADGSFDCPSVAFTPYPDAFPEFPADPARLVKDFNGDGKDDLYFRGGSDDPQDPNRYKQYMCLSDGISFNCTNVGGYAWQVGFGDLNNGGTIASTSYADIDGDGRVDQIDLGRCVRRQKSTGSGFEWYCGSFGGSNVGGVQIGSQTEPGAVRVFGVWNRFDNMQTITIPPTQSGTITADLNADGYSDMVFGSAEINTSTIPTSFFSRICYSMGNGSGDCRPLPLPVDGTSTDHLVMTVADFDGDGVMDVLRPANNTWMEDNVTSYRLCHVDPDAKAQRCEPWTGPLFYGVSGDTMANGDHPENAYIRNRSLFLGDFNGDGKPDIATYTQAGKWEIFVAADQAKPGEALDKLIRVTNGIGQIETVNYAAANDTSVYNPVGAVVPSGAKHAYPARQLVNAVSRENGVAGRQDTIYNYYNYATDPGGRGSLGFGRILKYNLETKAAEMVWLSQAFPTVGAPTTVLKAVITPSGTKVLSVTNLNQQALSISQANGTTTFFPYVASLTTQRTDLDGSPFDTTSTINYPPDQWGNTTHSSDAAVGSPAGVTFVVDRVSTYLPADTSTWRIGDLSTVTEMRIVPGSAIVRKVGYTYDPLTGLVATETRQDANATLALRTTVTYERNVFGLPTKATLAWRDPVTNADVSRVSQTAYDTNGRFASSTTNALGHTKTLQFDARTGAPTSVTTANNLTMTRVSDAFGRLQKEVATDGTETLSYLKQCSANCPPGAALVAIKETARGPLRTAVPTLVFSDNAGHALRSLTWGSNQDGGTGFDGRMIATEFVYDTLGRLSEAYRPRFVTAAESITDTASAVATATLERHNEYDALNRVTSSYSLDENGNHVNSSTQFNGFSVTYTNALQYHKTETRDALGRLWTVTDAKNGVTTYTHDAFNNLTTVTDPLGNVVTVTYDAMGHKTRLQDPDLGTVDYTVDAVGQVLKQVSPVQKSAGTSTTMTYDLLGRMRTRTSDDMIAGWTYDSADSTACATTRSCGKLVESYTMAGTTKDFWKRQTYDVLGRPDTTTTHLDADYTAQMEYDGFGRPLRETYQRGTDAKKIFDRRYNAFGALSRIERAGLALWKATSVDASSRVMAAALGNGLRATRNFNAMTGRLANGNVLDTQGMPQLTEGYFYDKLGNVTTRNQYWNDAGFSETFDYDELNRLKLSTIGQATQVFTYDAIGNIISKTGVGTGNYVYFDPSSMIHQAPHAVKVIPGVGQFVYDANGNLLTGAGRMATWTSFDMPRTLQKGSELSAFVYGPDYQRTRQTRTHGGVATDIYYAGPMEVEGTGAARIVKTYWPLGLGVEIDRGTAPTELRWTHLDRLGSVVAISDQVGVMQEKLAYDSWGKRRNLNDNGTPDSIDGVVDNKGYTGHEMLDQLDLVHMNGRVYDPFVARFMSADPIIQDPTHSQSYNRYTYVWNNPTNLTDPTGFEANGFTGGQTECDSRCQQLKNDMDRSAANCGVGCQIVRYWSPESAPRNSADNSGQQGATAKVAGGIAPDSSNKDPRSCSSGSIPDNCSTSFGEIYQDGIQTWIAKPDGLSPLPVKHWADHEMGTMLGIAANGIPFERPLAWGYRGYKAWRAARAAKGALPPLRQAYVQAVAELGPMADSLRAAGAETEQIARALHAERRAIGEEFKALTPADKLAEIYERNLQKYGDKLGPSVDWLRAQGKSWDQIIESATRTGGKDLGF